METEPFTFISDPDKGLVQADGVFPNAVHAYCCLHIAENVQTKFGLHARNLFWKIARCYPVDSYRQGLDNLHQLSSGAANYLAVIPSELYTARHFPRFRYEHDTSNMIESANASYLEDRNFSSFTITCLYLA